MADIEQGHPPPLPHRRSSDTEDETPRSSGVESTTTTTTTTTTNESCITQLTINDDNNNNNNNGCGGSSSSRRLSCCSSSSSSVSSDGSVVVVVDAENVGGGEKAKVEEEMEERDCRICHLSLVNENNGLSIELGCSCKHDLAAAHKHCAEAWFKIRGNKICEICGSTAKNVVGVNEVELVEQWNEGNDTETTTSAPPHPSETRHFWQGHRFLNFLLACMVFSFVISWLFHFNVPS